MASRRGSKLDRLHTQELVEELFEDDLHARRVVSLANGVTGVLRAATLSVHAIGEGYAEVARTKPRFGVKQVDRFLSNSAIDVARLTPSWAKFVVAARKEIVVALDWTEFDKDDHATICAYVVTSHGRATPLTWKTVKKSTLSGKRNDYEYEVIERLHGAIPTDVAVTLLADRAFGDQKLYALLESLGWDYVIRFRGVIIVEDEHGTQKAAQSWVPQNGRATMIKPARVTTDRAVVPAVVVVHQAKMREAWCLATSLADRKASEIVALYGKRFTIEETFRDAKDLRFGMGLSATHIRDAGRRDRLLLLAALAHALLTLLGAASEKTGMDSFLKVNTAKKRTHSLFRQGAYWYGAIPNMRDDWLQNLMKAFDEIVSEHAIFAEVYALI
ncbi:MAG: IS4 family transposase [Polyangiaceae bacterium]